MRGMKRKRHNGREGERKRSLELVIWFSRDTMTQRQVTQRQSQRYRETHIQVAGDALEERVRERKRERE